MADERTEKVRAIDLAVSQIEKQFGKGSIMRLGSKEAVVPIATISTGSISFDAALGVILTALLSQSSSWGRNGRETCGSKSRRR